MVVTKSKRLFLRFLTYSDQITLTLLFADPDVMRFGDGPRSPEWVQDWLRHTLDSYARRGYGPWAVVEKASGETIGYCGLFHYPDVNGRAEIEIGYRLARACWGQGYATEAVMAARDYAFNALGLTRLIALIDPANVASLRVATKAGLRHEADALLPGYTYPDRVYVIERGQGG
ncbi:Acetyltransferase [Candidatus Promineifilum breve]|uniref:Acetyltransferase n=1 Tax=Candidatus Promineifilum breve TaxID=1806508 RepID=A0A160T2L4_9CHLR|nr:GNAT family N-acetyltransferase [Candidatus Promineifilum breve]CUS03862.2 Acetyltransferase [Candidatus Promineifilum breve]